MIQELSSDEASAQAKKRTKNTLEGYNLQQQIIPFNWETAERVEVKSTMIQQMDLVFLNIPFKGY